MYAGTGVRRRHRRSSCSLVLGFMYQVLPGGGNVVKKEGEAAVYPWGPFTATTTNTKAVGNGWSRYNFIGYEGRGEYYTEYHQVVTTMDGLGDDPDHGCGRAMWENHEDNGKYGTTMALMLLPFWTDGCIGSMEGLFFEASGTTPYHFLTTAAMSKQLVEPGPRAALHQQRRVGRRAVPAGPRRALRDGPLDRGQGAGRRRSPSSRSIAESYPWEIYQVADSDIVVPLDVQPVVVDGAIGRPARAQPRARHELVPAPRRVGGDAGRRRPRRVAAHRRRASTSRAASSTATARRTVSTSSCPTQPIEPVPLDPVQVSNVEIGDQSLSFDVDQVGRAGARARQLLPELGGDGRRGAVPRRPEHDGGRAHRHHGRAELRPHRDRLPHDAPHRWSASGCASYWRRPRRRRCTTATMPGRLLRLDRPWRRPIRRRRRVRRPDAIDDLDDGDRWRRPAYAVGPDDDVRPPTGRRLGADDGSSSTAPWPRGDPAGEADDGSASDPPR